ncbi:MAG: PEP-CTERM sorting domain-containing protein [Pseudomonadota bacterium]
MFKQLKTGVLAIGMLAASAGVFADTASLAVATGWCNSASYCNNTDMSTFASSFAGSHSGNVYRNWLAFDIANEHVSAATLSIWSDAGNVSDDPLAVYSVTATYGISFAGLMDGPSFGTVTASISNTGEDHSVDIVFNAAGISFLNAHLGTRVVFGGNVTSAASNVQFFGHTDGYPTAYFNTFNTVPAVPEPESYAMLLAGLGLVGAVARRRKQNRPL